MPGQSPYETVEEDPEYFLELYELDLEELSIPEISERMDRPQEFVQKELETLKETIEEREIPEDYKEKFAEIRANVRARNWYEWSRKRARELGDEEKLSHLISEESEKEFKEELKSIYLKHMD